MTTTTSVKAPTETRHSLLLRKVQAVRPGRIAWPLSRVLFLAGSVLVPLGVLFLVLGWLGVARTVLVFDQLPYLASGGLIGLALVVLGGFLYFAHWQSLLLEDSRDREQTLARRHVELLERFDRITDALTASGGSAPTTAGATTAATAAGAPPPPPVELVVTDSGTMVHRPGCPVVRNRDGLRRIAVTEAGDRRPCRICRPITR